MGTKVLFVISMGVFSLFFYNITADRYMRSIFLAFPVIAVIGFIGSSSTHSFKKFHSQEKLQQFFKANGLLIARILLLGGASSSLEYFGIQTMSTISIMTGLNMVLRLASYYSEYDDGKYIFHTSFLLGLFTMVGYTFVNNNFSDALNVSLTFIPFYFAILAFIVFIIGYRVPPSDFITSKTRFFFHFSVLVAVLGTSQEITLFMVIIAQAYITLVFYSTYYIRDVIQLVHQKKKTDITAEDLLMGAKVLTQIKKNYPSVIRHYKRFLSTIITNIHSILYFSNIVLVGLAIYLYIIHFQEGQHLLEAQVMYWLCIAFFFINFLIIKKQHSYLPKIHKIIAFVVLNFAVFVNVFYVIGKDQRNLIVLITILWNYANAIAISQSDKLFPRNILQYEDYRFWIMSNMIAMIVNVGLLLYSNIDPQLMFAAISLYLGSYGFLTYYNIKYITKIQEQESEVKLARELEML